MSTGSPEPRREDFDRLVKRHDRERRARREAEAIAERVTGQLYATSLELEHANEALMRTNDELQLVNQTMKDFVAIASHDLRSPLTSILGFSSMMTKHWSTLPDKEKLEFVTIIERQGQHLGRLVEDLLTVSKIEAGALDIHQEVVQLHEVMRQAMDDFAQHATEIRVTIPPELTAVVDRDHLHRILVNFVGNALKYGEPPVSVDARDAGEWVEIRIRDEGEGVPESFLPRLFGRFARADTPAQRRTKGTGLGLSIVRGLAQANGGDTWYEPNEPQGSCFVVRLPNAAA